MATNGDHLRTRQMIHTQGGEETSASCCAEARAPRPAALAMDSRRSLRAGGNGLGSQRRLPLVRLHAAVVHDHQREA